MIKKNISYILSIVLLVLLITVIILDRSKELYSVRNKPYTDTLIKQPNTINVDTVVKHLFDLFLIIDVDSIYIMLKQEKKRLKILEKENIKKFGKIKDSIIKVEKLKSKEERLKIKELYENQLDKIPNYRGCDIDTFNVEIK